MMQDLSLQRLLHRVNECLKGRHIYVFFNTQGPQCVECWRVPIPIGRRYCGRLRLRQGKCHARRMVLRHGLDEGTWVHPRICPPRQGLHDIQLQRRGCDMMTTYKKYKSDGYQNEG